MKVDIEELAKEFRFNNLLNRYKVMEEYFDIKEGDIIVDGGAFCGDMFNYFSRKVGKTGKVIAFEPYLTNYMSCKDFMERNRLGNVRLLPYALWDKDGKIPFYLADYSNASSPMPEFYKVSKESVWIKAYTLDTIMDKFDIDDVDFVWTNIEGSEIKALKGMKKILEKGHCQFIISTHKMVNGKFTTNKVEKILKDYGYNTERVKDHDRWIYAYKTQEE